MSYSVQMQRAMHNAFPGWNASLDRFCPLCSRQTCWSRFCFALAWVLVLSGLGCRSRKQSPMPPPPPGPVRVRLAAVGDLLMHEDVKRAAKNAGSFEFLWSDEKPVFDAADIVFGNLETPVAPTHGAPGRPFLFNAPLEFPPALKRSGFTVLSTANNHAYDQGTKGVIETLEHLDAEGLIAIGSGRDRASAEQPRIVIRKGVRIAFLAWADLFNIDLNQEGKGPWVNKLDLERAVESVRQARLQADAVVVSLHWGNEDQHRPTDRQRDVADRLLAAGVDLILGHHPHVLQPLEVTETHGKRTAVAYSLGNFISNQNRKYSVSTDPVEAGDERDSMVLTATFVQRVATDGMKHTALEEVGYEPLWTENNWHEVQAGKAKVREIKTVRLGKVVSPESEIKTLSEVRRRRILQNVGSLNR